MTFQQGDWVTIPQKGRRRRVAQIEALQEDTATVHLYQSKQRQTVSIKNLQPHGRKKRIVTPTKCSKQPEITEQESVLVMDSSPTSRRSRRVVSPPDDNNEDQEEQVQEDIKESSKKQTPSKRKSPSKKSPSPKSSRYLHRRVAKYSDETLYLGTISASNGTYWTVRYDDGNQDENDETEILAGLQLYDEEHHHHQEVDTKSNQKKAASKKTSVKKKETNSKKTSASKKPVSKANKKKSSVEEVEEEQDVVAVAKKTPAKKKAATKKKSNDSKPAAAAAASKRKASPQTTDIAIKVMKKKPKKKPRLLVEAEAAESSGSDVSEVEGEEEEMDDKPFQIEYSPTSRSTCRRCDERITKDTLRISHVPLFRGKPGYTVYRHLQCAVFDETVTEMQHVGGWSRLRKKKHRAALVQRIGESLKELEEEKQSVHADELVSTSFVGPMRPPPSGLTAELLPFQKTGTSWMVHQELSTDIRGGVLADEMGMGKTIQAIVTILDNRPLLQHAASHVKHPPHANDYQARVHEDGLWNKAKEEWKHELEMNDIKINPKKAMAGARAGTLVVCPVIALSQWKSEIEKFTAPDTLKVGIYHGPNRQKDLPLDEMRKLDVCLTTYQVMEQDFRKMVSPNKVKCPNCGSSFKIDKLAFHLKYFCGEGAQRTEAQMRQRRGNGRGGGGGGSGKGKGKGSKGSKKGPPTTNLINDDEEEEAPMQTPSKKIRVTASAKYDTDSDLSVDENVILSVGRPSRSAAKKASTKVSASAKASKKKDDSDDDEEEESGFSSGAESTEESSSDESTQKPPTKKLKAGAKRAVAMQKKALDEIAKARKKGQKIKPLQTPDPEDSSSDDEEEEEDASSNKKRAVAMQKKALDSIAKARKAGKKVKSVVTPDPDETDNDSSDEDNDRKPSPKASDPLQDIDMDELVKQAMAGSRFSPLHSFCWWRIVLDEAHMIKSRASQTAAAAFSLTSIHRWALSGTPIHNRVGELYSLIRFLRIDPMALYFCRQKDCNCKSLHYRFKNGICQCCGHRSFSHYAHFNRYVLNPIQRDGYTGDGRRAVFKLKDDFMDKCLLRRTKATKAADLELPPRVVTLRGVRLHPVEEDFYNALYTQTKSSFNDYIAEGTLLNNYAHIFDLLTKMRQAVNHPYLIVYSKTRCAQVGKAAGSNEIVDDCSLCQEPPTDRITSSCCDAGFCRACVLDYLGGAGEDTSCPSCKAPFSIDLNQKGTTVTPTKAERRVSNLPSLKNMPHVMTGSILRRINLNEFATSTKIETLIQELIEMRQKRPGSKALVFSQFVNMLDLVRWRIHSDPFLAELQLGVRILHGGMDVKSRDATLKAFREDPSVRVLLMSLKSAGVALNLTAASEVYLLDLWWNPAAEMQALDRCHRIGQFRPIRAVRFVAEGTVEERVLQLQEKKRLVFDGTIGRDSGSLRSLTTDDMKALFN